MVLLGLIFICIIIIAKKEYYWLWEMCLFVIVASIILAFIPLEGWQEKQCISEEKLVALKLDEQVEEDKVYYVSEKSYGALCAVDASLDYELSGIAYEEKKINKPLAGSLEIYESKDCAVPILKTYKTKPKRGTFTLAPFSTKTDYVIYVPEGTVLYDDSKENSSELSSGTQKE